MGSLFNVIIGRISLIALMVSAIPVVSVRAQQVGPAPDYVNWMAIPSNVSVAPGDTFALSLNASIAEGWKMYAMDSPKPSWGIKFSLEDLPEGIIQAGDVSQSEPKTAFDPNFKKDMRYFLHEVALEAALEVNETAVNGAQEIAGIVAYQICSDELRVCLPPYRQAFSVEVEVSGATSASSVSGGTLGASEGSVTGGTPGALDEADGTQFSTAEPVPGQLRNTAGGFWGFLLLAIGAGLGALLMPCVFPMIPLTVSYFTKHAHDRKEAVRMASVYGLSIVVIFTGLGVLMAFLLGASGAQVIAANPWINLFIGLIFVVFALSLLGLFELRLPTGLVNYFNRQSYEKKGYSGVLFMGTTLTLVSFSCTAPFVGTLLAATAGGEWMYPVIGMLIFSATFALPFVVFALFPNGLSMLPASGSWMNTLKVVFGFIELAAAIKFLSNADLVWGWNLISRPLAISATVVILALAGFYLLGKIRMVHEEPVEKIGTLRLISAVVFLGLSLYMIPGLFGAPLNNLDAFLPPRQGTDVSLLAALPRGGETSLDDERWFEDREAAFAEAKALGKPVFIDFTGYTCTNCRQMEANVFPHPAIANRFEEKYVLLRLYTDDLDKGPDLQRFQLNLTGTVALPTYAVVHPETEKLISRMSGIASVEDFGAFLDYGASNFEPRISSSE